MPDVTIQKHLQSASMITGRRSGRSTLTRRRDTILLVVCIGDWRLGTEEHLHSPLEFRGSECESIYMTILSLECEMEQLHNMAVAEVVHNCQWYGDADMRVVFTSTNNYDDDDALWYLPLPTAKARSNNNLNSNFVLSTYNDCFESLSNMSSTRWSRVGQGH